MNIEDIRECVRNGCYEWSDHCTERMVQRGIRRNDVFCCILNGEIIQDYAYDRPFPSCLIFGYAVNNDILHVVVGYNGEKIRIITAYFPDISIFNDDFKTRR